MRANAKPDRKHPRFSGTVRCLPSSVDYDAVGRVHRHQGSRVARTPKPPHLYQVGSLVEAIHTIWVDDPSLHQEAARLD